MKKLDKNLIIFTVFFILSWTLVMLYFVYYGHDHEIQNGLKTYPYEHSKITDSTSYNGK
jgi:hypothetical protein